MKNMVYFFICNLLLVALFVLSSCAGHEEESHTIQNKSQTKDDTLARAKMSEKSNDDLLHWSVYTTLDGK